MIKLGVLDVDGRKHILKLGETYLVGRKNTNHHHDIEIDDASVDVKHCFLDFSNREGSLIDLRSKSGTYVGGNKVPSGQIIPLLKSTCIKIGTVETALLLGNESDSGYLEGRITPQGKDNSEVIFDSPETVVGSRLKHTHKSSLTSTPNISVTISYPAKSRPSDASNKGNESFFIPETQCPLVNRLSNNATKHTSGGTSSNPFQTDDDDFCIPETQEVLNNPPTLSNYPRVAFENDPINENGVDNDKIPSSQFRICTQDFNGSDDDLSNDSGDILANVPCSLIIPPIRHSPVQLGDVLHKNDTKGTDREMSKIPWNKEPNGCRSLSVTPDNIVAASEGSVTPDIFEARNEENNPQRTTPEEEAEMPECREEFGQTQIFIRPLVSCNTPAKSLTAQNKENDMSTLGATQKFIPPAPKAKPASPLPLGGKASSPAPPVSDDLPPTQVFKGMKPLTSVSNGLCFSSTLQESSMHPSENSFKAKCNKLLDSDDDEMDEIIAPQLAKNIRRSLNKTSPQSSAPIPIEPPPKEKTKITPPIANPDTNFTAPKGTAKKNVQAQLETRIDNFLFTPDVIGKEFTKDEQLQREAENNWNKIMRERQRKSLFKNKESSESECTGPSDFDTSEDSLTTFQEQKVANPSTSTKQEKTRVKKKRKQTPKSIGERLSEHRKSFVSVDGPPKVTRNKEKKDKTPKKRVKRDQSKEKSVDGSAGTHKCNSSATNQSHSVVIGKIDKESLEKLLRKSIKSPLPATSQVVKKTETSTAHENKSKHQEGTRSSGRQRESGKKVSNTGSTKSKASTKITMTVRKKSPTKDKTTKNEEDRNEKEAEVKKEEDKVKADPKKSKIQKEKPAARRITRLRSGLDSNTASSKPSDSEATSDANDKRSRLRKRVKTDAVPKNDSKTAEPTRKKLQQHLATSLDLTVVGDSGDESTSTNNSKPNVNTLIAAVTNVVKRKIEESTTRSKRLRCTNSTDSINALDEMKPHNRKLKIAMTMCDPRYQEILDKHSGTLWIYSKDPKDCDVLVVENGNRTYKILVAIARGIPIVNIDWLIEVLRCKTTNVPCDRFIFENDKFQERHHFTMRKSLQLARTKPVFHGMCFMMTSSIRPIPPEMSDIITCAGGIVLDIIPKQHANQRLFLVSQESDKHNWHHYRRANCHFKIVTSEGVMASVMQQSDGPLMKSVIA